MLKSIETHYKGYYFRSRTEARWAVFWEKIGLPFEYEFEGYDLYGTWYLPDFRIPAWDAFVEIKGEEPDDEALRKCELLHRASGKRVLLLYRQPWHGEYTAILFEQEAISQSGVDSQYLKGVILGCSRCDNLIFVAENQSGEPFLWYGLGHVNATCAFGKCVEYEAVFTDALEAAFLAARKERFENM